MILMYGYMDKNCEVGVFLKSYMKLYSFHSKEQNIKFSEKLNDTKNYADLLCTALITRYILMKFRLQLCY